MVEDKTGAISSSGQKKAEEKVEDILQEAVFPMSHSIGDRNAICQASLLSTLMKLDFADMIGNHLP